MKKLELILSAIAIIAFVMYMLLVSGALLLLLLSLTTLSIIYMYLSITLFNGIKLRGILKKSSYSGISTLRIIVTILTGVALAFTITGIFFTLFYWPGSKFNLSIGLIGLLIALIISLIKYLSTKAPVYISILKRVVIYSMVGLTLYLLPKYTILEYRYQNYPDYVEAFKNANANQNDQELWDKVDEEQEKINRNK
ncbi:MAG: hypothetical protein RIC35_24665 [Marinoscillum sp.]